jgi:hypothetical protein
MTAFFLSFFFVEKMGINEKTHSFWYKRWRGAVEYALIVIMYPHPGDLHSPSTSSVFPALPSFLSVKYQTTPSWVDLISKRHTHNRPERWKTRSGMLFFFYFSYLDQNGGQKEPGIKSSLHLFELLCKGIWNEEERKNNYSNVGCNNDEDVSFLRQNQLDSRWRQ